MVDILNYFYNENVSNVEKYNYWISLDNSIRTQFLNFALNDETYGIENFKTMYRNLGPVIFYNIEDSEKMKYYGIGFLEESQISSLMDFMTKNETPTMQRYITNSLAFSLEIQEKIKNVFTNEIENSIFDSDVKYVSTGAFYTKCGSQGNMPIQGWKLHVGADNIIDYYRLYKLVNEDIRNDLFNYKIKFVNPKYFKTEKFDEKGSPINIYGADLTIYLDNKNDFQNISNNLKAYFNESQTRTKYSDKETGSKVTYRYGRYIGGDFKDYIIDYNGNLASDSRNYYRPNFIADNSLNKILNINNIRDKKLEITKDFCQYAQEAALGIVSNTKLELFYVLTYDKQYMNKIGPLFEKINMNPETIKNVNDIKYQGAEWFTHTMKLKDQGVTLIPLGCEIEANKIIDTLQKQNIQVNLELHQDLTLSQKIEMFKTHPLFTRPKKIIKEKNISR